MAIRKRWGIPMRFFTYEMKRVMAVFAVIFLFAVTAEAKPVRKKKGGAQAPTTTSESVVDDGSGNYVTEKRSDGSTVKYKKKTSYDFEGLGVEAMADKPTGAYISNIKDVKAKTLIQIRKDFDAEVNESARQMP
jgi:hypothetical protein